MIVAKFGGTSVSTAERIRNINAIVSERRAAGVVVVVSALAGVTDTLLSMHRAPGTAEESIGKIRDLHQKLVRDIWGAEPDMVMPYVDARLDEVRKMLKEGTTDKESRDKVAAQGEIMSSYLIAEALKKEDTRAEQIIATELIVTDGSFGDAEFVPQETREKARERLIPLLEKGIVPVVTGFIGATSEGHTTTLGRGGSDYTAAILGLSLDADQIEIWTDVSGIMTTDPRIVPEAKTVPELAFEEACELAYFGAKVLHPKTILPAIEKGIPVKVLNTLDPANPGTTIVSNFAERRVKSTTIEAFSYRKHVAIIHIYSPEFYDSNGLMVRMFKIFENYWTSIEVFSVSVVSVSLAVDDETDVAALTKKLAELGEVTVERGKSIVCAVGGSMNAAGVAGRMFTILDENNVPVELIAQAAGGFSMTFAVAESDVERAIKVLHEAYIGK
jgi:aspartate kinase